MEEINKQSNNKSTLIEELSKLIYDKILTQMNIDQINFNSNLILN